MLGQKLHQAKDDLICSLALSSSSYKCHQILLLTLGAADLILSTLLFVVLHCWLLNDNAWAVEGECC